MKILYSVTILALSAVCVEALNGSAKEPEERNFCEQEANPSHPPTNNKDLWCFNRLMRFRNYWKRRVPDSWGYAPCSR